MRELKNYRNEENSLMEEDEIYSKVLNKVLGFLAYRPRTWHEVGLRLPKYFKTLKIADEEVITRITRKLFDFLKAGNLVNDDEFGKLFVEAKAAGNKAWGRKVLVQRLMHKGISREKAVELVAAGVDEEEQLKTAIAILTKKWRGFETASISSLELRSIQAKMQRFLASRGFTYDTIRAAIDYFLNHP